MPDVIITDYNIYTVFSAVQFNHNKIYSRIIQKPCFFFVFFVKIRNNLEIMDKYTTTYSILSADPFPPFLAKQFETAKY